VGCFIIGQLALQFVEVSLQFLDVLLVVCDFCVEGVLL
jgi:hypothetical protein